MMQGLPEVEKIMSPLSEHIKDGADERNRQHYNYVYEAFMRIIEEKKRLECFQKFYLHIRRELNMSSVDGDCTHVCCKLCNKTFEEITGIPELTDV
jgi:hypothetical protein